MEKVISKPVILRFKNPWWGIVFDQLVAFYSKKNPDFFFIQVGASDGKESDPIYQYIQRYHWRGVLIEPLEKDFALLKENYHGCEGLFFENIAIANEEGIKDFFYLEITDGRLPVWAKQLGSFSKEIVLKHQKTIPDIEKYLTKRSVNCAPLKKIFKKYEINKFDFLQIDTEGYDYEIIRQMDFQVLKPKIIRFEHKHLTPFDYEACLENLRKGGYLIATGHHEDTYAFLFSWCFLFQFLFKFPWIAYRR